MSGSMINSGLLHLGMGSEALCETGKTKKQKKKQMVLLLVFI